MVILLNAKAQFTFSNKDIGSRYVSNTVNTHPNTIFKRSMFSWASKVAKNLTSGNINKIQKRHAWGTYKTDKNQVWQHKEEMKKNPSEELKEKIENLENLTKESGGINNEHPALGRSSPGSNEVKFKYNVTHGKDSKNKPFNQNQNLREFSKEYTADKNDLIQDEQLAADGSPEEKAIDDKINELEKNI